MLLIIPHQHRRRLGAGGLPLRIKDTAPLTTDKALTHRPTQCILRIRTDLLCINKVQHPIGYSRTACTAVEDSRELLAGDRVVGAEAAVAVACGYALAYRPADGLGVVSVTGHIGEVQRVVCRGGTGLPPEDGDDHAPGGGHIWTKGSLGGARHQTFPPGPEGRLSVPGVFGHIGEGMAVAHGVNDHRIAAGVGEGNIRIAVSADAGGGLVLQRLGLWVEVVEIGPIAAVGLAHVQAQGQR